MSVTPKEFIKAWEESESLNEVAGKVGLTYWGVNARACYYRKKGIKLKRLTGKNGRPGLDTVGLNAYIDSLNGARKRR